MERRPKVQDYLIEEFGMDSREAIKHTVRIMDLVNKNEVQDLANLAGISFDKATAILGEYGGFNGLRRAILLSWWALTCDPKRKVS